MSPPFYKTPQIGFCPCSSVIYFQKCSSIFVFTKNFVFSSRAHGCLKRGYKSNRRSRHPSLLYGILYNFFSTISTFLGNQKIAEKSSHNIRMGLWALVNEGGMCPVLLTEKCSVKDRGSSIQSAPVEELLQNNEQQEVVLEGEVSRTFCKHPADYIWWMLKGTKELSKNWLGGIN